jgi:hypothetical protein
MRSALIPFPQLRASVTFLGYPAKDRALLTARSALGCISGFERIEIRLRTKRICRHTARSDQNCILFQKAIVLPFI